MIGLAVPWDGYTAIEAATAWSTCLLGLVAAAPVPPAGGLSTS